MAVVEGYIVQTNDGRFLNRHMHWMRHPEKPGLTSLMQTYVHSTPAILAGGSWAFDAHSVRAAVYDPGSQCTEVIGVEIPFKAFLARHEKGREFEVGSR